MKEISISKNEGNQRIDKFLRKYMPKAQLSFIYKILRKKYIKVNGQKVDNTYILQENDRIQLYLSDDTIEGFQEEKVVHQLKKSFEVVYEDENMLLVAKPSGLLLHEDKQERNNTLVNQVIKYLYDKGDYDPKQEKTFVPASVNRLDRNTSGIVIIGKNYESLQNLNEMLRSKNHIRKFYLALVKGELVEEKELKGYLLKNEKTNKVKLLKTKIPEAKEIHTIIKPLAFNGEYSFVEVEIITGKSHQIRLHLSSIGHPIVGDEKYGDHRINKRFKESFSLESQYLHAYKLVFNNSIGNLKYLKNLSFYAPLPKLFEEIKKRLF